MNQKTEKLEINDIPDINVDDNKSPSGGPVEKPVEGMNNKEEEPVYDNPDIIKDAAKENNELYEKLIKINEQDKDEEVTTDNPVIVTKVEKPDIKEKKIESVPVFSPNLSIEETLKKEQETRKYDDDRIVDITKEEEVTKITPDRDINIKPTNNSEKEKVSYTHEKKELSYIEDVIDSGNKSNKELMTVDKQDEDKETVDLFYDDLKNMSEKKGLTMDIVDETKYTLSLIHI